LAKPSFLVSEELNTVGVRKARSLGLRSETHPLPNLRISVTSGYPGALVCGIFAIRWS
jgi:hypothetical protein